MVYVILLLLPLTRLFYTVPEAFTKLDCVCKAGRQCAASLASFVSRMPKHVDNIDLTSGADVKLMLLIYVQEEASLSPVAPAICLLLILRDRSADLVKAVQQFWTTLILWIVRSTLCLITEFMKKQK